VPLFSNDQVFPNVISGATTELSGNVTSATKAELSHELAAAAVGYSSIEVGVRKNGNVLTNVISMVSLGERGKAVEIRGACAAAVWAADV